MRGQGIASAAMAIAMAAAALGAGYVNNGAPASSGGQTSISPCTAIAGTLGILTDWTSTTPTNKSQSSTGGFVGAEYSGDAATVCTPLAAPVPTETSTVTHRYNRSKGAPTTLSVTLSATASASGTAKQYNPSDPSWWWVPTIAVDDDVPVVTLKRSDGSTATQGVTPTDAYDEVSVQGTGGSSSPADGATLSAGVVANPGKFTVGAFAATTGVIPGTGSGANPRVTDITVSYSINSSTNREADNAKVQGPWLVGIGSTLTTSVSP